MHAVAVALGPSWLDPNILLQTLGPWALWGAAAIVFAECGLLIGFFLPGDSLLFTVGLLASTGWLKQPLWLACAVLTAMAFLGNVVGYEIGRRAGPAIFRTEDSRLFKKQYVEKTVAFFDKYGTKAIMLARFVPIVRTFITVTAGVGQMNRQRYLTYSGVGGVLWASGVTVLGSLLGRFAFVKNNLEAILLSIVLVSVVPIVVEYLRERAKARRGNGLAATPDAEAMGAATPDAEAMGAATTDAEAPGTKTPGTAIPKGSAAGSQPVDHDPWAEHGARLGWGTPGPGSPRPAGGGRHVS